MHFCNRGLATALNQLFNEMTSTPPPLRASTSPEHRRHALLDALWDASGRHAATTPKVLVIYIIHHVREHPGFDALRLDGLVRWLGALRDMQPDDAKLAVGRAEVNRLIDKIVAAYDVAITTTTTQNSAKAGSAKAA
jgi:hypothetical protein